MINGWLVYNVSLTSKSFTELNQWFQKTAQKKGVHLELKSNVQITAIIENGNTTIKSDSNKPKFVLFMDKDIRLAKQLESIGLKVFNNASIIEVCDDKIATFQKLANHNIKMPKTIIAPFIFNGMRYDDIKFLERVENELQYPIVVKEAFGSFGEQVYLVNNRVELESKYKELMYKPHIYQEFIKTSIGRDVRVCVVGDDIVASMMRYNDNDFRANVANGGFTKQIELLDSFKEMALKVTELLGADFVGVDILFGENDEPILCEVNSNPRIRGIYECTGVDFTEYVIEYILKQIQY